MTPEIDLNCKCSFNLHNNDNDQDNNNNMWVNDHCVMRSPIVEPGSLGSAIKISALSREPGNPGLTVSPMHHKLRFMGDLDDVQFQPIY